MVCVVHLVHRRNGVFPLQRFLASYTEHAPGLAHSLVFALKGFERPAGLQIRSLLERIPAKRVTVPAAGRDIGAYRAVAEVVDAPYVCFLNSFSVLRADGWLAKLFAAASLPHVGVAGATGSWESFVTNHQKRQRDERLWRPGGLARWVYRGLRYRTLVQGRFPPFPNPHVRTNGFLMRRDLFLEVTQRRIRSRWDAYRFESGSDGLSRRLVNRGLELRVVDRHGRAHAPAQWPASRTFWSEAQENLLIADNQTLDYERAEPPMRAQLRSRAWGDAPQSP